MAVVPPAHRWQYIVYIAICQYCTAVQETRIPSETCSEETCITDGKHASLVIYVRGHTHPYRDMCAGNHIKTYPLKEEITEVLQVFEITEL